MILILGEKHVRENSFSDTLVSTPGEFRLPSHLSRPLLGSPHPPPPPPSIADIGYGRLWRHGGCYGLVASPDGPATKLQSSPAGQPGHPKMVISGLSKSCDTGIVIPEVQCLYTYIWDCNGPAGNNHFSPRHIYRDAVSLGKSFQARWVKCVITRSQSPGKKEKV